MRRSAPLRGSPSDVSRGPAETLRAGQAAMRALLSGFKSET
jgi:hypothetical protein